MKELNHKLQEKTQNLHTGNSTTTSTTLSTGPGTNTTTTPAAAAAEGCVFNSIHHAKDLSTVNSIHPHWEGSPIKHPEMKVENKSTIAVELHSPTSSGASQDQTEPVQLIQLKEDAPAEIDGQVIPTSEVVVLDPDAQCVLSGVERNRKNSNNEGGVSPTISLVKQRMISSNKMKI